IAITGTGLISAPTISFTSSAGGVSVTQGTITGVVSGTAAQSFSVTASSSGLSAGSVTANNGSLSLIAGTGKLYISSTLTATNGSVVLQNTNINAGSIEVGNGVNITASGSRSANTGNVYVVIGPISANPSQGKKPGPSNWSFSQQHSGHVVYGDNG